MKVILEFNINAFSSDWIRVWSNDGANTYKYGGEVIVL